MCEGGGFDHPGDVELVVVAIDSEFVFCGEVEWWGCGDWCARWGFGACLDVCF